MRYRQRNAPFRFGPEHALLLNMLPFHKVVFPVDYSDGCAATVPYVKEIVGRFDTGLTLVHAYGWEAMPTSEIVIGDPGLLERIQTAEQSQMDKFVEFFRPRHVDTVVQSGDPAAVIHDVIRHRQADLVMLPTHGRGPVRRILLGSIAAKVLHDTSTPVWTATPEALASPRQTYTSVLCACDLQNEAEAGVVLKAASWVACTYGARLTIVHILGLVPTSIEIDYAALRSALQESADSQLTQLKETVGVEAPHRIAAGPISTSIRDEAVLAKADLIVTGRGHNLGVVSRAWSHLYQIVREAPCPVLSI
jgi:nucleotide-binding universal stress UspA family protein